MPGTLTPGGRDRPTSGREPLRESFPDDVHQAPARLQRGGLPALPAPPRGPPPGGPVSRRPTPTPAASSTAPPGASHAQVGTCRVTPSDSVAVTASRRTVPTASGPSRRRPPPSPTAAPPTAPATRACPSPPPASSSIRAVPPSRTAAGANVIHELTVRP